MGYFTHVANTNERAKKLVIALESQINSWESEKIKWDEYIIDILEVQ